MDYSIDDKMVAIPRNEKNPAISVTVVKTMDDDCAGGFRQAIRAVIRKPLCRFGMR